MRPVCLAICSWLLVFTPTHLRADSTEIFQAGAASVDVTPTQSSSIIAGGFLEARANSITDRLYVRAFVLDDGKSTIALAIVDTCMMPQELIDKAKQLAANQCGIPVERMMVSATHTHSAPASMGCLGTSLDEPYAQELPLKIAQAIVTAHNKRQPARIGWASIDDWEHTHNRRWIRKPDFKIVDPFGQATGRAHMHPGYLSRDVIGPSGPVDPSLSVISMQTLEGKPLAVLANYSQHYFGSTPVSADYFGLFSNAVADALGQSGGGHDGFVCAMSQGTSGDLMWMDYGSPAKTPPAADYANAVAKYATKALAKIQYQSNVPLNMVEKKLELRYRVPDSQRLEWAKPIAEKIENGVPKSLPEVYAREALILHERQSTSVKLQAISIGDLTIATLPNEVYALTGLKLKARSPGQMHFNIELANGAEGYIPPPEQHTLGGYTTWPARTAGLEVDAEPKIVETLVVAMEEATGKASRTLIDEHGEFAKAVLDAEPLAYMRLNETHGATAHTAVANGPHAKLEGGFAWYLPGVGAGSGIGDQEHLTRSPFSGPSQINRAVHLASGTLSLNLPNLGDSYTIQGWFWLGEASGASDRVGTLCALPDGRSLQFYQDSSHRFRLECEGELSADLGLADDWHSFTWAIEPRGTKVYVDGGMESVISTSHSNDGTAKRQAANSTIFFGEDLQGKLDELAVFPRVITDKERVSFWNKSGMATEHLRASNARQRNATIAAVQQDAIEAKFSPDYSNSIAKLQPVLYESLQSKPVKLTTSGTIDFSPKSFANFREGRLTGEDFVSRDKAFSLSLWFENRLANDARPVTAYLFSRGPGGDATAPGDHLGIGGTHRADLMGKLFLFNGNARDQLLIGKSTVRPRSWNHVVLVRDGEYAKLFLNGGAEAEFDGPIYVTVNNVHQIFFGARSDNFAPLQGQLAHVALFNRVLNVQEIQQLFVSSGVDTVGQQGKDSSPESPKPSKPLSPEESLAALHVASGFRAELAASEPLVLDPVAFDWDAQGRLWVVEMADYPSGMDGKGEPGGRVRVLTDKDSDGRYDESHVFAEGLNFPNGIITWRDGVIVTASPYILWLRDTDGDGKAEKPEVLFEGFQEGNQQLRLNGLRWGLDGWVYCANGGHHANYGVGTKVTSRRLGQSFEIGSRDFCFRPDTGELRLESGPSQFGRNRDANGHWFGVQNAKPLWHYVIPDRYLARNPHIPTASPIHFVLPPGSPPVYPASLPEKRFHSFQEAGHFTSACSGMIYGDELLFGRSDQMHAFTCEPFHNLIQHNVLSDDGATFGASRPVGEGRFDFFASEDRWSRPVMARTGPDGALWIADMVRYMIEHPDWLPPEGKEELLPHYRLGDDLGRIYRIVPEDQAVNQSVSWPFPDLERSTLIKALQSANDWQRDKAQQLILWSGDARIVPELEHLVRDAQRPISRLQALATLNAFPKGKNNENAWLKSDLLIVALQDPNARVREHAVLVAETSKDARVIETALKLADDTDAKVCLQLALSIGEWSNEEAGQALVRLAERFHSDPWQRMAIMSSALRHSKVFAQGIARSEPVVLQAFREDLLRQAIGSQDVAVVAMLLQAAVDQAAMSNLEPLDELLLTLQQLNARLEKLQELDTQATLKAPLSSLAKQVLRLQQLSENESEPMELRIAAARTLTRVQSHRGGAVAVLAQWLTPQIDSQLQQSVLKTLAQSADDGVPSILANAWKEMTPALRTQTIEIWTSRAAWTVDLLSRIDQGAIQSGSLDLSQRSLLMHYPDGEIAKRATKLFGEQNLGGRGARKEVVDRYRTSLSMDGDLTRGKAVYQRACASCHRRGDEGYDVGPNLATVVNHSPERLLTNILDPNVDIQPGYQAYTFLLDGGEILSGLLASETSTSLTIKQAGGGVRTLTRNEIERLQNSNVSLMPEGLEVSLTEQEMADLLKFLGPM